MQNSVIKGWIDGVFMQFPISIGKIELDVSADGFGPLMRMAASEKSGPASRFQVPNCTISISSPIVERNFLPKSPANQRACNSISVGTRCEVKSACSWTRDAQAFPHSDSHRGRYSLITESPLLRGSQLVRLEWFRADFRFLNNRRGVAFAKFSAICSTMAARERGKTKRYFGPFPAAGK